MIFPGGASLHGVEIKDGHPKKFFSGVSVPKTGGVAHVEEAAFRVDPMNQIGGPIDRELGQAKRRFQPVTITDIPGEGEVVLLPVEF